MIFLFWNLKNTKKGNKKMKAKFSTYLTELSGSLKELIELLSADYDYVSVLASDSKGFSIQASQKSKAITGENMTTERGCVVRVYKDGLYSEYAFNKPQSDIRAQAVKLKKILFYLQHLKLVNQVN